MDETPRAKGRLLTPAEVADHLQISTDRLSKMRIAGNGPAFSKLDARTVRYHPRDVVAFIESCKRTSTGGPASA